jgi:hypothetical protein
MKLKSNIGYSAVAAAVAVACGAAYAAVPTATLTTFSAEGNATAPATAVFAATVTVTLGSDYIANDTVELGLTGASFITGTSTLGTSYNGPVTCGSAGNTATLGFLSRSATTANYRVTGVAGTQNNAVCSFSLPVSRNTMATAGATQTVSWTAKTAQSGLVFDAASRVATIGSVTTQFTSPSSVTRLNGVVDVDSGRYQFETDDGSDLTGSEDSLTFSLQNASTLNGAADLTSVVAVINGDFSFVDGGNTSAGCQAADLTSGHGRVVATNGTVSINSDCTKLTFTATAAQVAAGAAKITLGVSSASTTPTTGGLLDAPQSFTVDAMTYSYAGASAGTTGSSSVAFSSTGSAGSWTLNGSVSKIAYMPYGTGISRIVYITNRSTQSGGVSATAFNDAGVECEIDNVATATKGSVTNLSAGLDAGVAACYGASFNGKVAFEITANIPGDKAEVYSAYNVNGNRVIVVNDTNGKTVTAGATQN